MSIKFGTDGWRAIIADDFTVENVEKVAQATAQWLFKAYGNAPSVVIGYDCRFGGELFTKRAAAVFASMGINAAISDSFTTTPAISWAAKTFHKSCGIVITASHNPPEYSGYKIKAHFGGPASPQMIDAVELELTQLEPLQIQSFDSLLAEGKIEYLSLSKLYIDHLANILDLKTIQHAGTKIAYDAMYGAGRGMVSALVGENVVALHHDNNPGFNGQAPEPIEKNLTELSAVIQEKGCDIGLATDGDADRIGLYDENGVFVDSHKILCLLVKYLYEERGLRGDIVKTFSTTGMLDAMGAHYGLTVHTTKIGFKYIGEMIVEGDVLVGGEESGGMAVKGHIPERDGVYIGLLVAEMMAKRGKKLSELVQELYDQFGNFYHARTDLHTQKKDEALNLAKEGKLATLLGNPVTEIRDLDGFKLMTNAGWLMFRGSGTEPLLRIYAEADSLAQAEALVAEGVKWVQSL